MDKIWFKDELVSTQVVSDEILKSTPETNSQNMMRNTAQGIVRADKPRWRRLDITPEQLTSGVPVTLYQVRLSFQFDLPRPARESGIHFVRASCFAYLWPAVGGEPQPTVYDLYPRDLYDGGLRNVAVEFKPELKIAEIGGSLGSISSDVPLGQVEPVIVGWTGENERAPHWDLRPSSKKLLGTRYLWLLIERPQGCSGVRLAAMVDAELQTRLGPIPVGPRTRTWDNRPSVVIR